jgi:hypothetical protein
MRLHGSRGSCITEHMNMYMNDANLTTRPDGSHPKRQASPLKPPPVAIAHRYPHENLCIFRLTSPNIVTRTFFLSKTENRSRSAPHSESGAPHGAHSSATWMSIRNRPRGSARSRLAGFAHAKLPARTKWTKPSGFCHSHPFENPRFSGRTPQITRTKLANFASRCGTPENNDNTDKTPKHTRPQRIPARWRIAGAAARLKPLLPNARSATEGARLALI